VPPVGPLPALRVTLPHGPVQAVAVVLHGGRAHGTGQVRPAQLAVLRMVPFATALNRAGAADGLAVARLRYLQRGWNGAAQAPVADARWALDELERRFPGVPAALVGHSMGGRTALYVADHPNVQAVVSLAPWLEPGDPVSQLAGTRILIAHGTGDRMTSPRASAAYARAAAEVAASVSYVSVRDERHAMLRRARLWHELATGFVLGVLRGKQPDSSGPALTTNVLRQALAGKATLVV
jgi:predicted alpha/beta-hydrolase family hydrolase